MQQSLHESHQAPRSCANDTPELRTRSSYTSHEDCTSSDATARACRDLTLGHGPCNINANITSIDPAFCPDVTTIFGGVASENVRRRRTPLVATSVRTRVGTIECYSDVNVVVNSKSKPELSITNVSDHKKLWECGWQVVRHPRQPQTDQSARQGLITCHGKCRTPYFPCPLAFTFHVCRQFLNKPP